MLALYIIGAAASYLTVGYKCAMAGMDYSVAYGSKKSTSIKHSRVALFAWPYWMCTKGTEILFSKRITAKKLQYRLKAEQERDIQKILESGEI